MLKSLPIKKNNTMTEKEINDLFTERDKIRLRIKKSKFVDPKDMRRVDQINSLLLTDGKTENLRWKTVKGREHKKGLNATKPYSRKGKVG